MNNHITVAGCGKLGACIAVSFAQAGLQVTGYDLDSNKVQAINDGRPPVEEPGLAEAIVKAGSRLTATTDVDVAVQDSSACIFITPTPSLPDGSFDNTYLLAAIDKVAGAVSRHKNPFLFIIASTVTPGSCDKVLLPAIQRHLGKNVHLVYKPEFIALGTVMRDLANPDVSLFGARDWRDLLDAQSLYSHLTDQDCKYHNMSLLEAELAKISLNCAITMKISFANQVGMVAEKLGVNPHVILNMIGSDSRVGPKALRYGLPYSGPCFPRDARMFQYVAEQAGITPHLAIATDRINRDILQFIFDQVPTDGDIGILGFGYKAGATLAEESAGLLLKLMLETRGRTVKVHDPTIAHDCLEDVLACRTVIVASDCPEYRDLAIDAETVIDPMGITKKTSVAHSA